MVHNDSDRRINQSNMILVLSSLLAMIALSAVQSSNQTRIHNDILFIDTSVWRKNPHSLTGMLYLTIKASNEYRIHSLVSKVS